MERASPVMQESVEDRHGRPGNSQRSPALVSSTDAHGPSQFLLDLYRLQNAAFRRSIGQRERSYERADESSDGKDEVEVPGMWNETLGHA